MECKKCGKILSEQERFCTYCGYYNDPNEVDGKEEENSNNAYEEDFENNNPINTNNQNNIEIEKVLYENPEKLKTKCLKIYLNTDYKSTTETRFNLFAFLFSWIYFIYKKMYLIGILGLVITGLLFLIQPLILIIYAVISMILSGLFFNKIYLWYVNKTIDKVVTNKDPNTALKLIKKASKDNIILTLGIYFIFLILVIVLHFSKSFIGYGGDKFWKENTNNKNKCLLMIEAAKKNSKTSQVGFIIESGCEVVDSTNSRYNVYLKFDKGNNIIIEKYTTDPQKMYLEGSTNLLTEYENKLSTLSDRELKSYQDMLAIKKEYLKLQQLSKVEDSEILNKQNKMPKKYYLIIEEIINE